MSVVKDKVKKQIRAIKERIANRAGSYGDAYYYLAKELHEAAVVIHWKHTEYRSFAGFIRTEIDNIDLASTYRAIYSYRLLTKWFSEEKDILKGIHRLGITKMLLICGVMKRRMSIDSLIKKYLKVPVKEIKKSQGETQSSEEAWGFSLPDDEASKLTGILEQHGMTNPTGKRRHGVREAMISFLKTL